MARILIPAVERPPVAVYGARHRLGGATMGTSWSVEAYLPASVTAARAAEAVEAELAAVIAAMSTWEADSFISRFNRAPAGCWMEAPAAFIRVLTEGLRVAALSEGAFDPACGAAVEDWGFGPAGPVVDEPAPAPRGASWRDIRIEGARVFQPGVRLDFSGIAKGHAVDLAASALERLGAVSALVEIGGELKGWGVKADGAPWWVALETPPDAAAPAEPLMLALHGVAVATSGDWRRTRMVAGRPVSHTIDPATGAPLYGDAPAAVSVVHESCMTADALATALIVMGTQRGLAFAAHHGIAARIVTREAGRAAERLSPTLAAMLG